MSSHTGYVPQLYAIRPMYTVRRPRLFKGQTVVDAAARGLESRLRIPAGIELGPDVVTGDRLLDVEVRADKGLVGLASVVAGSDARVGMGPHPNGKRSHLARDRISGLVFVALRFRRPRTGPAGF